MQKYDIIIIGAGPAGLTAAIYASRARLNTLVLESFNTPGQAILTSDIENYPGFPEMQSGFDLMDKFKKQAQKFGAIFKIADAKEIAKKDNWQVKTEGETLPAHSVIVATGARPKKLEVPGEDELRGKGVSYCAVCDAALFKGKEVAVVGGGNTAVEEAVFLTKFASKVTIIHRRDRLRADEILQERARASKKIDFAWKSTVTGIKGEGKVQEVVLNNVETKKETVLPCRGIFIFVGYVPNTGFLKGLVKMDENGYVLASESMETSQKGIFASGDARKKTLRQIVTACGDGAIAAVSAKKYIDEIKGTSYE